MTNEITYSTSHALVDWETALNCLREHFPSLDQLFPGPSCLSADALNELFSAKWKYYPTWDPCPEYGDRDCDDMDIFDATYRGSFSEADDVFVANDFVFYAKLAAPFLVRDVSFRDWVKDYQSGNTPLVTFYDGDVIAWSKRAIYIVSHEGAYFSANLG